MTGTAAEGRSRLSAHLACGTISMRCVHQATEARIAATPDRSLAYALRGFASRLRWHCHFMQKLEDEPEIEWRNMARSVDGLRPGDGVHESAVDCEGRTGFPMVDACMRQLCATGWPSGSGCRRSAPRRIRARSLTNERRWQRLKTSCTACAGPARHTPRPATSSTGVAHEKVACHPPRPRSAAPGPRRRARASCTRKPRFQGASVTRKSSSGPPLALHRM